MRYWYATGYPTKTRAALALEEAYCTGEVCESERPEIQHYPAKDKAGNTVTRYGIRIGHDD